MSAQCSSTASSKCRSSAEAKMLGLGGSGLATAAADETDALLALDATPPRAAAILLSFSSWNTSNCRRQRCC